jgi:predicted Rossmann fold flavoprotein
MKIIEKADVAVVGAGPAGMMAAIAAGAAGAKVVICEQLDQPGTKLVATGGGRCNVTNALPADDFVRAFGRQGRFITPALSVMDSAALLRFFDDLGVPTVCQDGLHVFPASNNAADIRNALVAKMRQLGVTTLYGTRIRKLVCGTGVPPASSSIRPARKQSEQTHGQDARATMMRHNHIVGLETSAGQIVTSNVILAAGGLAYPSLGATGDGLELARAAGHPIIKPLPALAPLVTQEDWTHQLPGVSVGPVRITIALPGQSKSGVLGQMIFTHRGISGPAALNISSQIATLLERKKPVPIKIDLKPSISQPQWLLRLDQWHSTRGNALLRTLIAQELPAALAFAVCAQAGLGPVLKAAHADKAQQHRLAAMLTALPLTVTATEGFAQAMVMRGGVDLKQVDPRTLQSKLVAGLYFAGELLDLDGPSGGYNLQWAFSSGFLAGANAAKEQPQDVQAGG